MRGRDRLVGARTRWRSFLVPIGLQILLAMATTTPRAKQEITASWGRGNVSVDGAADEWQDTMTFLEGPGLLLGARNDGEYLYLCFYSNDPEVGRRAVLRGLDLELGAKGNASLRIRFPVGLFSTGRGRGPRAPGGGGEADSGPRPESFILLGEDSKDRRTVVLDEHLGIELRTNRGGEGTFVYEARIPLLKSEAHPYAVGGQPGGAVTVKLETAQVDPNLTGGGGREGEGEHHGGTRGGGGHGGMGGMGGRGGMGGGGNWGMEGGSHGAGAGLSVPKPLKLKAEIRLALPPSAGDARGPG